MFAECLARCSAAGSPSHTARSVVGRFMAVVKHQAALEWQRVCSDIRWNTGLPFSWFRGRDPSIQEAAFRDKWCTRGVVASWQPPTAASPRGSYAFRLSAAGVLSLSGDSQAQQWVQRGGGPGSAWQGPTFWQHHTSSSRGVLLKAGLLPPDCHPVVVYRDDQATEPGHLLRVGWALPGNQHLSVVAVYAPCEAASRPAFFAEAFAEAVLQPQFQHSHLIVAGDFNCVLEQRDVQPTLGQPAGNSSRLQGAQDMRLVCQAAALQDAWCTLHPAQCDNTHHSAGQHASAGRTDAVWVSQDLFDAGWVTKVQHLHDAPIGDHAAVLLELQQPDTPPPLGPGRWIFPNDLLGLVTALADLKAAIEQYKQIWQLHGRVLPIEVQRWEDLKAYIQQYCVAEQKRLRQQRQQDRRQLARQLRTARRLQHMFPIPATTAGLLAAKRALQLHEQAQAASRARCQEAVHDVYGEASTYYFHRLGKPPPESQLITEVANPAQPGSTVSLSAPGGTQQAATIFADYYDAATGGLFTVHPTTAADQQLLLAAVDSQLSPEEQRQCLGELPDGSIQEDEAEAALRSLPRGKAPGSDGLTYDSASRAANMRQYLQRGSLWRQQQMHNNYESLTRETGPWQETDGLHAPPQAGQWHATAQQQPHHQHSPRQHQPEEEEHLHHHHQLQHHQHHHHHQQQQQQQQPMQQPEQPSAAPTAWKLDPFDTIRVRLFHTAGTQQPVPLPAVAAVRGSSMPVTLRLMVGQLSAAAAGNPGSQQRIQLYTGLVDLLNAHGDAHPFPWMLFVTECSQKTQAGRGAYIDVVAQPDSASTMAALAAATAGHLQVASYSIPVVQMNAAQPLDTVELVVQQPPLVLGFIGFTAGLLESAGYPGISVVAEWRGGSRAPGGAPELSKQFHSVIAWVRPPHDDPQLRSLPDTFQDPITGATCRILVRTRLPHGLQQFHARQFLTAATAAAQPAAEQQPLATPTGTDDQEMQEASPPQQAHNPAEAMDLETPAEADPPPQQPQQQEAHQQPRRPQQQEPQLQEPTRQEPLQEEERQQQQQQHHQGPAPRRKRSTTKQPAEAQVHKWMASSAVWCNLAEQAQHLLETLERPWTEQEKLALASAYMLAFERSSLVPPCTDGYAEESSSQRRYPARGNRGLPANPWFAAAPTSAAPQANPPTEPTGARGRHGRKRQTLWWCKRLIVVETVKPSSGCSGGAGLGIAWQGPTFWQHHTSSSRGVGILLKEGLVPPDCHPVVEYRDDQATEPGRLLRVGWALPGNQHLSVVAVYAPCEAASRPAFSAEAFAEAVLQPQFQHSHLIVAGDFNCVLE
eukprot:gene1284-biopygen2553